MKLATARHLALGLPEAKESDHHGRPSFRVRGRIFVTVPDDEHLHVMVDSDATQVAITVGPAAFSKLWWGKKLMGVKVALEQVEPALLIELLAEAWRQKAPVRLRAAFDAERASAAGLDGGDDDDDDEGEGDEDDDPSLGRPEDDAADRD